MLKKVSKTLLVIFATFQLAHASPNAAACEAAIGGGASLGIVLTNMITTVYNLLPIRFAGIPLGVSTMAEDYADVSSPICVCPDPFPRIGLTLSFWEPFATMDVSGISNCIPSLGVSIPLPGLGNNFQAGTPSAQGASNNESYQVTYIKYPFLKLAQLLVDVACLSPDASVDSLYPTSIDPTWQSDSWSIILTPDALLFTNMFAQFACIADSVAANFGFPLDPLYWCIGSWGNIFPLGSSNSGVASADNAMAASARMIFKMHRELILWGSLGNVGLCGKYPMPIMRKSAYALYPIYPLMLWPFRTPIGRSGMIWAHGQNTPGVNNHVWTIMTYRKRDCCVF